MPIGYFYYEQGDDDGLGRTVWAFRVWENLEFKLSTYTEEKRKTKRHKFRTSAIWGCWDKRQDTLKRTGIPVPLHVLHHIKKQITAKVQYVQDLY